MKVEIEMNMNTNENIDTGADLFPLKSARGSELGLEI